MSTAAPIAQVTGRQIFDSRGRPTVEAEVRLADGSRGRASVPSGTSTGRHEAHELRDGDPARYQGLGVLTAVEHVQGEIARGLAGRDALDQGEIDHFLIDLDGTPSLRRLGANAVLAVSLATARAAADHCRLPLYRYLAGLSGAAMRLPMPMTNLLSGGAHVARGLPFQDFQVVPMGAARFSEALEMIARGRAAAEAVLKGLDQPFTLAGDGGIDTGFLRIEQALDLMMRAFEAAGLRPGIDIAIALDIAASELLTPEGYRLEDATMSGEALLAYLESLTGRYPILSLEDVADQDDWDGWRVLTARRPDLQIVGDDLFATNPQRVRRGIAEGAANAALIKPNQNGTLSGTLAVMEELRRAGRGVIVAGRSGDTEDSFIADLAVGGGAGQIKIGAFRNSERLAKYNRLLEIEAESALPFAGMAGFAGNPSATL